MDLRLPNITAGTDREQIEQIKSYLYQLVGQLEWIFSSIDKGDSTVSGGDISAIVAAVKPMLIQASEIVSAYYEQMKPAMKKDFAPAENFEQAKKQLEKIEKRLGTAEETIAEIKNLYYCSTRITGSRFSVEFFDERQNIFLFGCGICGNLYANEEGNAVFDGNGVSFAGINENVYTVELLNETNGIIAGFSARPMKIY